MFDHRNKLHFNILIYIYILYYYTNIVIYLHGKPLVNIVKLKIIILQFLVLIKQIIKKCRLVSKRDLFNINIIIIPDLRPVMECNTVMPQPYANKLDSHYN